MSEALRNIQQQTPSPPPSPDRENLSNPIPPPLTRPRSQSQRRAFSSYLSLTVQTPDQIPSPQTANFDGGFPVPPASAQSRSMFSPSTPRSMCPKKQPRTPSGPPPRTQPYGYPYFAMMPNGEYADIPPELQQSATKRRFGGSVPHSRSGSIDLEDQPVTPSTATPANTLGLELGQLDTPRGLRGRQMATVS